MRWEAVAVTLRPNASSWRVYQEILVCCMGDAKEGADMYGEDRLFV